MMRCKIDELRRLIIGRTADGGVERVEIDCSAWRAAHPQLTEFRIDVTSPSGVVYLPVTHMEGDVIVWPITQSDTADAGKGTYQVVATGGNGEQKTSEHPVLVVSSTMPGTAQETPPPPSQPWVDKVLDAASAAKESADKAEAAVVNPPIVGSNGNWWLWDFEAGEYVDSGKPSQGGGGEGGGATYHSQLMGRDADNQHPINAIAGLREELDGLGYTLPPATADTLGGVMPGQGIWADADGRISTDMSGRWEHIRTITLDADTAMIDFSTDKDGQPFELEAFRLECIAKIVDSSSNIGVRVNTMYVATNISAALSSSAFRRMYLIYSKDAYGNGKLDTMPSVAISVNGPGGVPATQTLIPKNYWENATRVRLVLSAGDTKLFAAESTFELYGVRA